MAKKIRDIAVKTGEYEDQHGNKKGRWQNVGSLMQGDDGGLFIILERTFNPAGVANPEQRSSVVLSCFDVKGRDEPQQRQTPERGGGPSFDDEIPFAAEWRG